MYSYLNLLPSRSFVEHQTLQDVGLPDAFCKNTGHFILSTAPDPSSVVIRKRHRENREKMSIVVPQLFARVLAGSYISVCA